MHVLPEAEFKNPAPFQIQGKQMGNYISSKRFSTPALQPSSSSPEFLWDMNLVIIPAFALAPAVPLAGTLLFNKIRYVFNQTSLDINHFVGPFTWMKYPIKYGSHESYISYF